MAATVRAFARVLGKKNSKNNNECHGHALFHSLESSPDNVCRVAMTVTKLFKNVLRGCFDIYCVNFQRLEAKQAVVLVE